MNNDSTVTSERQEQYCGTGVFVLRRADIYIYHVYHTNIFPNDSRLFSFRNNIYFIFMYVYIEVMSTQKKKKPSPDHACPIYPTICMLYITICMYASTSTLYTIDHFWLWLNLYYLFRRAEHVILHCLLSFWNYWIIITKWL